MQLGLTLWESEIEGRQDTWLRWTDLEGNLVLTSKERADLEQKAKEAEKVAKEAALEKAEKLVAKLKELGVDPSTI